MSKEKEQIFTKARDELVTRRDAYAQDFGEHSSASVTTENVGRFIQLQEAIEILDKLIAKEQGQPTMQIGTYGSTSR